MPSPFKPDCKHPDYTQGAVDREILRLHKRGAQPHDLADRFGRDEADVRLLLFGDDTLIDHQLGEIS
jgi:hypothetical protein